MRIVGSVVFAVAIGVSAVAQTPVPGPIPAVPVEGPSAPAIALRIPSLSVSLDLIGGRFVRVVDLRVDDVRSPQTLVVRTPGVRDGRAVVVLSRAPAREFVKGMAIEVWGRAYTAAGAHVAIGWPAELRRDDIDDLEDTPIIAAVAIRTLDGVDLYRQAP